MGNKNTIEDKIKTNAKEVPKGWGKELWIVNCEEYCGKLLYFDKGKRCSWHYHKLKDETFYILKGAVLVRYSEEDDIWTASKKVLISEESFHVYRGLRHQIVGLEDAIVIEFSTQHFDEDSYRIIKGDVLED